ncbi:MAG: hypothetical protein E7313_07055 [Clostridiales bacterium]|nr:hypothetical protein [Clostridiales bacterium]
MNNNYDDIIDLPHYVSKKRHQMSREARSAQFAPFAALTGFDDAIKEKARLTEERIEIDDGLKEILSNKLMYIQENLNIKPELTFTYFVLDSKKSGGKYVEKKSIVRKIDMIEQYVQFVDKTKISINEIISIEGELFSLLDID